MEKKRPTYDLDAIKAALGSPRTLAITTTALRTAMAMGYDRAGIVQAVTGLDRSMFYKSMTTYADHRVWQDVYHAPAEGEGLVLYIKFQADVVTEFRVMSFKERSDGS